MNPSDLNVVVYRSYHINADSKNPYNAFSNTRYGTFTPFSIHILFVFWIHLTHDVQKSTLNFIMMDFSPGMLALRYAPGTPKITTYLPSCALIMRLKNRYLNDMVVEDDSYLFI